MLAFVGGYFLGGATADADAVRVISMAGVGETSGASASIEILDEDEAGNWPMNVVAARPRAEPGPLGLVRALADAGRAARGLVRPLHRPRGPQRGDADVPYALRSYDGWVVTRHGSPQPLLTT